MGKQILACPQCHKKLRVPMKAGSTLRITCPRCQGQFQVSFPGMKETFNILKSRIKYFLFYGKRKYFLLMVIFILVFIIINSAMQRSRRPVPLNDEQKSIVI